MVSRRGLKLAAIGLGSLITPLDTAVNIAFPDITASFGLPMPAIQWVVICYVLTYSSLMLACGRVGDLVGHARVFRIGLAISTVGYLLCGLAPGFGLLLGARVVQGIGAALYEECLYDENGQMLNANMADYLVPMSGEMPDIVCGHVETPTRQSQLGAKGAGEAGTAGAPGAVMNAINDALAPLGASVSRMPFTPERILKALGKA